MLLYDIIRITGSGMLPLLNGCLTASQTEGQIPSCVLRNSSPSEQQQKQGAHQAALVGEAAVASDKRVACYALPEYLHAQDISYQLLCLLRCSAYFENQFLKNGRASHTAISASASNWPILAF